MIFPLRGFWTGRDIELKEALHLYPEPALIERDQKARHRDKQALLVALKKAHLLPKKCLPQATAFPELDDALSRASILFLPARRVDCWAFHLKIYWVIVKPPPSRRAG